MPHRPACVKHIGRRPEGAGLSYGPSLLSSSSLDLQVAAVEPVLVELAMQ